MHAHDLIIICGIVAVGFVCQWLAWRAKLPSILFLLLTGIVAGPLLGVVQPDALFGDLLVTVVSLAVAIILFEGSLTLEIRDLRGHGAVVRNLVTLGVLVTWVVAGLAAYFFLGWDPYLSALFGAIVTVSGPTVVMPLLRTIRPRASIASILRWEAILIDPLGAILGLLVFDFILTAQSGGSLLHVIGTVVVMIISGSLLGALGGYLLGIAIRARKIPDFLRNYAGLAAALTVFAAAEAVRGESGLLAVTVMGIWLANMRGVDLDDVLTFKESLTLVLVAALFIVLAARLDLDSLQALGWGAVLVFIAIQFLGGPLRAFLCSIGSALSMREKLFLGWVFPRGIVAAAISALFALRLEELNVPGADSLVPLVFMIIIGTVVLQSVSAQPMSRWLNVAEPPATGVLIIGANAAAREIAAALKQAGVRVLVSDSHWASIREARMRGLETFFGSAVSGYADDNLELTGLGKLLAMSRKPGLNELACVRFAADFGRDQVFTLGSRQEREHSKHKVAGESIGRVVFGREQTLEQLIARILRGETLVLTELSSEYTFEDYREQNPDSLIVFAVSPDQEVVFPVSDTPMKPLANWQVAALRPPSDPDRK
jgi:CPA1 family monovalent cation:H+ antiporter